MAFFPARGGPLWFFSLARMPRPSPASGLAADPALMRRGLRFA